MIFGPLSGRKNEKIQNIRSGDAAQQLQIHGVDGDRIKIQFGRGDQPPFLQQKPEKCPQIQIIFIDRVGRTA